jgi:hypothetical protein
MSIHCAKCGEELMGVVNRCWQCGQEFDASSKDRDLPPVRRRPVLTPASDIFVAELSDTSSSKPVSPMKLRSFRTPDETATVRRGSPFADRGTAILEAATLENTLGQSSNALKPNRLSTTATQHQPAYRQASGGATASAALVLPLGVVSFIAAFLFPLAGVLLALLGIGFSIWGLFSRRRIVAVAGLVICILSLTTAAFHGSVAIYKSAYGVAPWQSK